MSHSKEKAIGTAAAAILIVVIIALIIWNLPKDHLESEPRTFNYRLIHTLQFISNSSGNIQVNCTVPRDTRNFQIVRSVNYSVTPSWSIIDEHNNTVVHFEFNLIENEPLNISITTLVEVNETSLEIISLDEYDFMSLIYQRYTKPERYIESDNPQIKQLAFNLTSGCSDKCNTSRAICKWVNSYLNYSVFSSEPRGALWALENGIGDCSEYSHLFIALCRSVNIPARFIDGIVLWSVHDWGLQDWTEVGHDWAEVYLPNAGWIWVDPTADHFGYCDGKHIALQHGQYCKALRGYYRYSINAKVDVTEHFEIFPVE